MIEKRRHFMKLKRWLLLLVMLIGDSYGILSNVSPTDVFNSKYCPDKNCKCDGVNIICDCSGVFQEVTMNKLEGTSVIEIKINNCNKVIITTESIKYLSNLRFFEINNVRDLQLQYKSLNWCGATECTPTFYEYDHPSLDITIKNTTISEIQSHVFSERLRNILLKQVNIKRLKAYAFTNLKSTKKLEIQYSYISGIEAQAFKKFYLDYLSITNSNFESVPSRTFADIEVKEEFKIRNSNFTTIKPLGFMIKNTKTAEISYSNFDELEGESFKISSKGRVQIKNNLFKKIHPHAFMGISTTNEARLTLPELQFSNNTLNDFKKESIIFNKTSFIPKLETIILNETCSCSEIHIWQTDLGLTEEIYCLIQSGRMRTPLNAKLFKTNSCTTVSKSWVLIIVAVVIVLVVIVGMIVAIIYRRYRIKKHKEYVNRGRNKDGSLGLIVPDGRTYRETELHVIVEKAELLTTEL